MNQVTLREMQRRLGIESRETFHRYYYDRRIPQPRMLAKIEEVTGGQVRLQDFLDPTPPKCAKKIIDANGHERIVLPGSRDYPGAEVAPYSATTDGLSPPVQRAFRVLAGRAAYTRKTGNFFLDGRLSDLRRIMRAANEELKRRGEPPIPYPGVEPLE